MAQSVSFLPRVALWIAILFILSVCWCSEPEDKEAPRDNSTCIDTSLKLEERTHDHVPDNCKSKGQYHTWSNRFYWECVERGENFEIFFEPDTFNPERICIEWKGITLKNDGAPLKFCFGTRNFKVYVVLLLVFFIIMVILDVMFVCLVLFAIIDDIILARAKKKPPVQMPSTTVQEEPSNISQGMGENPPTDDAAATVTPES